MKNSDGVIWSDAKSWEYHNKQWETPKASTLNFINILKEFIEPDLSILDLGCGGGAATYEIANRFSSSYFCGIDSDSQLIDEARVRQTRAGARNLAFEVGDIYNLNKRYFDGVISLQTLSWLPGYEVPITQIAERVNPNWIAMTSLFYPGEITATTLITEHIRNRTVNYNTYSLPQFSSFCATLGYETVFAERFELPFDIKKPEDIDTMGTYTIQALETSRRIQLSGPILMNWMTVILKRKE